MMPHGRDTQPMQGTMDGLCGLYCIVRAMHRQGASSLEGSSPLRYLLEAAERLNLFAVGKICNGYEAHELVSIFNEFCAIHAYPYDAKLLRATFDKRQRYLPLKLAKSIFESDGLIIVSVDKGEHWVLAHAYDEALEGFEVQDPDPDKNGRSFILQRETQFDGLAIFPTKSAPILIPELLK